jgi:hypothetical protein
VIISDSQKQILVNAEAALVATGCANPGRLMIQRGVGWLLTTAGIDWKEEKAKIKEFVDGAHIVP